MSFAQMKCPNARKARQNPLSGCPFDKTPALSPSTWGGQPGSSHYPATGQARHVPRTSGLNCDSVWKVTSESGMQNAASRILHSQFICPQSIRSTSFHPFINFVAFCTPSCLNQFPFTLLLLVSRTGQRNLTLDQPSMSTRPRTHRRSDPIQTSGGRR